LNPENLELNCHRAQVQGNQVLPKKNGDERAYGEKRSKRDLAFAVFFFGDHESQANDRPQCGSQDNDQQDFLPTEQGPHSRDEFDVASAHASPAQNGEQIKQSAAQQKPENGIDRADQVRPGAQSQYDSGEGDDIGNDFVLVIDHGDDGQSRRDDSVDRKFPGNAEPDINRDDQQGDHDFNQGIDDGKFLTAGSAFSAQNQIAENGDVVERPNGRVAGGAVRTGKRYGLFLRQSVNADIGKTPDEQAEYKDAGDGDRIGQGEKSFHK